MDETDIVRRFILARSCPNINYFALDLVSSDFEAKVLAEVAKAQGQANHLGFFSEVIEQALVHGYWRKNADITDNLELVDIKVDFPSFQNKSKSLKELHELLYIPCHDSEGEFLYTHFDDRTKRIFAERKKTGYEEKWHVRSTLTPVEMADWLHIYFRWETEESVRGHYTFTQRDYEILTSWTSDF